MRPYRSRLLPTALFLLLISVPVGIWWFIDTREDLSLEDLTDQYATNIAIQIQAAMDTRLGALRVLAERIAEDPAYNAENFDRSARRRLREFPGLAGLTWADRTHVLRWGYPHNPGIDSLLGKDARSLPSGPFATRAVETGIPVATPPLDLRVGSRGFVCVFPAAHNGTRIGTLAAILRVDEILRVALGGEPHGGFALRITDGASPLFTFGQEAAPGPFAAERQVQVLDRTWTVSARPNRNYISRHKTFSKNLLLVLGFVLSAAVALAYWAALDGRRRAEHIQQRFQDIAESATDWLWELDRDYRYTYVSPQIQSVYGRGPETMLGQDRRELPWSEDNPPGVLEEYRQLMAARKPFRDFEIRSRDVAGRLVVTRLSGVPVLDEAGRFAGYRGTGTNVTAEVEAKQATQRAEQRLDAAMESLPGGFLLYDAQARLVMWNSHLCTLYPDVYPDLRVGMSYEDVVALVAERHLAGGPAEREARMRAWIEGFHQAPGRSEVPLRDGRIVQTIDWRISDGSTVCLRFDISEAKQREEQLRSAKSLLFDAIEAFPAAFTLWDQDERLVLWNTTVEQMNPTLHGKLALGMTFEQFVDAVSADWAHLDSEAERAAACRARVAAFRAAPSTTEARLTDGRVVQRIDWRSSNNATVSLSFDVTEARRREEELRHAQRMESLGQLTGGIAHDFNNLLTVVLGYGEFLKNSKGLSPHDRESLDFVLGAALRGSTLIKRLMLFSRSQPMEIAALDPSMLIAELAPLLEHTLGENIHVVTDLDPGAGTLSTDRGQLESVLMNLAINSRDAMRHGGRLTLKTRRVSAVPGWSGGGAPPGGQGWIEIEVTDTGEGMSEDILRRAFDPFFTTKGAGKGTGLGLSMVYRFVQSSGGHVMIDSAPARGTTVRLWLPAAASAEGAAVSGADEEGGWSALGGGRHALIVEDDADVGAYAREVLESLGFRTSLARDSAQAQVRWTEEGPWDLLFTDVVLPGSMNGPKLAQWARERAPALPVLFTSGYSDEADPDGTLHPMLRKPYRRADLAHELKLLLTPQAARSA